MTCNDLSCPSFLNEVFQARISHVGVNVHLSEANKKPILPKGHGDIGLRAKVVFTRAEARSFRLVLKNSQPGN